MDGNAAERGLGFAPGSLGKIASMLRKAMWTGLYAGLGAAATLGARTLASRIWRLVTGEQPPVKK